MIISPKVGIALATYNPCMSYFLDQISSLKGQTYKNWICIIVDDNSNSEKFQHILDVIGEDPRFEIHRNGVNLGSFKTFERALSLMPSEVEFVCYCDQDDIWTSGKLEIQLKAFEDQTVQLVHTDQSLIDEKGRVFVASCWDLEGRSILEATTDLLLFRNLITGCTTMFRRNILKTALPFYPLKPLAEMYHHDMWVAMHACVHGRVLGLKDPLVLYRQHGNNLVGVATLKRNFRLIELSSRAAHAFSERVGMREDFIDSLERCKLERVVSEKKRLSFLDSPFSIFSKGLRFVLHHPYYFRTWVMLLVGFFSLSIRKKFSMFSEEAH